MEIMIQILLYRFEQKNETFMTTSLNFKTPIIHRSIPLNVLKNQSGL
jgi:hypothetical protein